MSQNLSWTKPMYIPRCRSWMFKTTHITRHRSWRDIMPTYRLFLLHFPTLPSFQKNYLFILLCNVWHSLSTDLPNLPTYWPTHVFTYWFSDRLAYMLGTKKTIASCTKDLFWKKIVTSPHLLRKTPSKKQLFRRKKYKKPNPLHWETPLKRLNN